jgi:hypothetical protein
VEKDDKEKSLVERMESGEINLKGWAAYFINHKKKHPTYDTIYAEHNAYWSQKMKEWKSIPNKPKEEDKEPKSPFISRFDLLE